MTRRCSEGVVADFPIHSVLIAQETVNAQLFKWEHAAKLKEIIKARGQENVGIKIEAAEMINRKIPKEIVALNSCRERVEHGPVLGKFGVNELIDPSIVEKHVFEIGVQQSQIRS